MDLLRTINKQETSLRKAVLNGSRSKACSRISCCFKCIVTSSGHKEVTIRDPAKGHTSHTDPVHTFLIIALVFYQASCKTLKKKKVLVTNVYNWSKWWLSSTGWKKKKRMERRLFTKWPFIISFGILLKNDWPSASDSESGAVSTACCIPFRPEHMLWWASQILALI